jgi:Tol biopolymer transport system component
MFGDEPRPPAVGGTIMPLSSKRQGKGILSQIYFATRGADGAWSAPNQEHLASINSPDYLSADGFLSADGLSLYFASKRSGNSELYVARRTSLDDDFGEPAAVPGAGVNTPSEERMPWLSADERTLYFASNRLGSYAVYIATREAL